MSVRIPAGAGATAVAALGGSLAAHSLQVLPGSLVLVTIGATASVLLCRRRWRTLGVLMIFFALTAGVAGGRLDDRWSAPLAQTDVPLHGWIDSFPESSEARTVFTLRAFPLPSDVATGSPGQTGDRADPDSGKSVVPERIRLSWYEPPPGLEPGIGLEVIARIRAPRGFVNRGGFDYERWLLTEGIGATGYVRGGRIAPERRYGVARQWIAFRAGLASRIRSQLDNGFAAELLVALALGVRNGFDDEHWDVLRRTGTSHLVAISGLHVGLVAAFAFQVLLRACLLLPYRLARHAWAIAAAGAMIPAATYAALAGFALPTVRALIMLTVIQIVVLSGRRVTWGTGLAVALVAVLALSPMAPLGASFWLSFGAVALIMISAAMQPAVVAIGRSRPHRHSAAGVLIRIQIVLGLGLAPVTLATFGEMSIAALPVNLLAVPVFSLILVPLALLLAFLTLLDAGSAVVSGVAAALAGLVWDALVAASSWQHASVKLRPPSMAVLVVALVGVALFLTGLTRARWRALIVLLPLLVRSADRPGPGAFSLTVLDVGHGLAVVVRTEKHVLLYDTGPLSRSGFDTGLEVVAPALRSFGIDEIDRLVLSHGDSDHAGGLRSLAGLVPADRRLVGPDVDDADARTCQAGQGWVWDQVTFTVLHPSPEFRPEGNESSCVVRIESRFGSALLTGDIEARAEARLVATGLGRADLVVVPHHGSATSSTAPFVRAVEADYAVVSAAYANRWNFPRPDVSSRWRSGGAELLTTGASGAVVATFSRHGVRVDVERETQHRYWRATAQLSGAGARSAL